MSHITSVNHCNAQPHLVYCFIIEVCILKCIKMKVISAFKLFNRKLFSRLLDYHCSLLYTNKQNQPTRPFLSLLNKTAHLRRSPACLSREHMTTPPDRQTSALLSCTKQEKLAHKLLLAERTTFAVIFHKA